METGNGPLLGGHIVIVESGGKGARAVASFDKTTGALRWTSHDDQIVYSSPIPIEFNGRRQIVVMTKREVIGLDLKGQLHPTVRSSRRRPFSWPPT